MKRVVKKSLVILSVLLLIALTTKGQNLFLLGNKSFPSTETFTLQSNSVSNDLNILFAKDGTKAIIGVSIKLKIMIEQVLSENLIIYLDDGTVISCEDRGKHDYVDNITSAVYYLTSEQLNRMKISNINTVRYTLKSSDGYSYSPEEGSFSASNKGHSTTTDFPALLTDFFKDFEITVDDSNQETNARTANAFSNTSNTGTTGQSEGVTGGKGNQGVETGTPGAERYGLGVGTGNISFSLSDRGAMALLYPPYDYQGEGRVVVEVTVDQSGRVTNARAGVMGSTTQDKYLLRVAREAALKARFDSNPNKSVQKGTITYIFKLK